MAKVAYQDFEILRPELLRLARSLLRGSRVRLEPEDLVQGVLTRMHAALQAGTLVADSPRAFAYAALKNHFLDEARRMATQRELLDDRREGVGGEPRRDVVDRRGQDAVATVEISDLLARLSPSERCFVGRVVFEEMSVVEAQKACGWPDKSPHYQLRLLLDRLARLGDLGPAEGRRP